MIRVHVIQAVTKRNFGSYFSSILGYLFIIVFCVTSAVMAFNTQFFTANQANLDQLTQSFPLLLLFIIPAITMTAWSDEKKLGTDELLFTLPATELEILIGKFKAVAGVYTVALAFSLVNVLILSYMGSPDYWMLFSTYAGYWLAGVSLLSVGLLASSLTSSATVAFVLGVVFCCVPVFIGNLGSIVRWIYSYFGSNNKLYEFQTTVQGLSLQQQLQDFGVGVMPLSSILYFVLLTTLMLYLNHVVICKRRWASNSHVNMTFQYAIRTASLFVIFVSAFVVFSLWPARADFTSENLFTLSDATYSTFDGLDEQNITIQAFVSPEVPSEYSETRRRLLGLLREFDQRGGKNITVRVVDVEPFSEEAEEARALGVSPARIQFQENGRVEEAEVFLGAVIQSTTDRVEIPFFGLGLPIEYELTRSVRTVASDERLTVGVLQTDANVISAGGFQSGRDWRIVQELKQQYKVVAVDPSQKILQVGKEGDDEDEVKQRFDVLLAIMPSSLTDPQMNNLLEYVEAGEPTLVFDDPFPLFASGQFGLSLAPRLPKPAAGGGMMGRPPAPEPKADNGKLTSLLRTLNLKWGHDQVVFDKMRPPQFDPYPEEFVFVSQTGNPWDAFNRDHSVTEDLQNMVMLYSGTLLGPGEAAQKKSDFVFTSLLQTSARSGKLDWDEFTSPSFDMFSRSQTVRQKEPVERINDKASHVLAAHVTGKNADKPRNVIFCADIDVVSDLFFNLRQAGVEGMEFDNVSFVLNAVDMLAGNEQFIKLRSRRAKLRTLEFVESQVRKLRETLNEEEKAASEEMQASLKEYEKQRDAELDELNKRDDLDINSKKQLLRNKQEQLESQLADTTETLQKEKDSRIRTAALEMKRKVLKIENGVKLIAYIIPAILPICVGLLFLGLRNLSESQNITPERKRR